jgi:8-oxo-dGTP pyrophosphatase MutT (NUDIX family)
MSEPSHPTRQYFSSDFVIAAGSILFRRSPETDQLQVCLLYHRKREEWLLPKGRKDCGETISAAAVRETFEETGYPCELLPLRMPTRAPEVGTDCDDFTRVVDGDTEPFALSVREVKVGVKTIWWYVTRAVGDKVMGTQMASEAYDSHFVDAENAISTLTFKNDQDLVRQALDLVLESGHEKL